MSSCPCARRAGLTSWQGGGQTERKAEAPEEPGAPGAESGDCGSAEGLSMGDGPTHPGQSNSASHLSL